MQGDSSTTSDADTTDEATRTDTGSSTETGRTTKTEPATDGESPTPDGLPEWTPDWTEPFGDWAVLGLNVAHSRLYTTLQVERSRSRSAVAAVDPADGSVLWRRESEGEAVAGSHAAHQPVARGTA